MIHPTEEGMACLWASKKKSRKEKKSTAAFYHVLPQTRLWHAKSFVFFFFSFSWTVYLSRPSSPLDLLNINRRDLWVHLNSHSEDRDRKRGRNQEYNRQREIRVLRTDRETDRKDKVRRETAFSHHTLLTACLRPRTLGAINITLKKEIIHTKRLVKHCSVSHTSLQLKKKKASIITHLFHPNRSYYMFYSF